MLCCKIDIPFVVRSSVWCDTSAQRACCADPAYPPFLSRLKPWGPSVPPGKAMPARPWAAPHSQATPVEGQQGAGQLQLVWASCQPPIMSAAGGGSQAIFEQLFQWQPDTFWLDRCALGCLHVVLMGRLPALAHSLGALCAAACPASVHMHACTASSAYLALHGCCCAACCWPICACWLQLLAWHGV